MKKKLSHALFYGKVKKEQDVTFRRCYCDAAKALKFSDAISKALAIYALSARRITKLLRKKTYSKFLSGKFR